MHHLPEKLKSLAFRGLSELFEHVEHIQEMTTCENSLPRQTIESVMQRHLLICDDGFRAFPHDLDELTENMLVDIL